MVDSVGIDTALKVGRQTRKDLGLNAADASEDFLAWVVEKSGRLGRKNGKGFYDYDAKGKRLRLWPELLAYKDAWRTDADVAEMKDRFLTIQALEAARCFEEGVLTDPRDADVGAILGWGFAPFHRRADLLHRHGGRQGVCRALRGLHQALRRPLQTPTRC